MIMQNIILITCGVGVFLGGEGGCRPFWKMINIFAYTSPNRSGVGAIDNSDQFEQIFIHIISPRPLKKFSCTNFDGSSLENVSYKALISSFPYYNLY